MHSGWEHLCSILQLLFLQMTLSCTVLSTVGLQVICLFSFPTRSGVTQDLGQRLENGFQCGKVSHVFFDLRWLFDSDNIFYTLYGVPFEAVEFFRYLEVKVSNDFRWDMHIDDIASNAYQRLGMLKRVLYGAPRNIKQYCIHDPL